ncbi:MAG: hypothetical protein WD294_16150 [Phycisphaeraceae bacterium]
MAWVKKIETDRQRRIVVAIIMAVLFAASVGAAAWVTVARNPGLEPTQAGSFHLLRPSDWQEVSADIEPTELVREIAGWREPEGVGGAGRRLGLLELRHDSPIPPAAAMEVVMNRGNNGSGQYGARAAVRSQLMTGLLAERAGVRDDGQPLSQLLAVMTLDGYRHAVLVLEREGDLRASDWRLMVQMSASLADTRYQPLPTAPLQRTGEVVHVTPPDGLAAVERRNSDEDDAQAPAPLLLIPTAEAEFYVLEPSLIALEPMPEDRPAEDTDDDERLLTALARRYNQLSGEVPAIGSVRRLEIGPRKAYRIGLPNEGTGSGSILWAVHVEPDTVLLMQVTASRVSIDEAEAAARRFVAAYEPV